MTDISASITDFPETKSYGAPQAPAVGLRAGFLLAMTAGLFGGVLFVPLARHEFAAVTLSFTALLVTAVSLARASCSVIKAASLERKLIAEQAIRTASDIELQAALKKEKERGRAKAAYIAAMSHDLRTPLNIVIGFSDLMKQQLFGPVPDRYCGYVTDIHSNGLCLLNMTNDILDLSRIEARLLELVDEPICLREVMQEAGADAMENKSEAAPIKIEAADNLPFLRADEDRVRQMLRHILGNAVKFTKKDGEIALRAGPAEDGGIAITIADCGSGMEPALIPKALEPFKGCADGDGLEGRFEDVGVGLPLVNALMRLHGGRMDIESTPGKGTTVTLLFPPGRSIRKPERLCA